MITQAVQATHSLDNAKIISYLHSGATMDSVLGAVKFDALGENTAGKTLTFQWQNAKLVQSLPAGAPGVHAPVYPKPAWKG